MGTTRRTKYRIDISSNDKHIDRIGIDEKPESLQKWCEHLEKSELPGGCNEHNATDRGYLLNIYSAVLRRQKDGVVIEEYYAPAFRVV